MRRKILKKPKGLSRALYRAPIWLYKLGLGALMGERFLLLTHTGRISGKALQTVIEVVSQDKNQGAYYVVSGWGEKSDWLQNLERQPRCVIQVGRKRFPVLAERISDDEAEHILLGYANRHPRALRSLASFTGFEVDGSEEDYRRMARQLPIVAFNRQN